MPEQARLSSYAQCLVSVAKGELSSFGGVLETDTRLRSRIYNVYLAQLKVADPGNSLGWDMSSDITSWPWSAVFVSWCALAAGATAGDFAMSIRHAVYVKAAIANARADKGTFRAWPIDSYIPRPGDIIVANRGNGSVTYDEAAALESYDSHGAIVVDIVIKDGKSYAVTVGGNESQSIHSAQIELTSKGTIRARAKYPFICVIQDLKDRASADAREASGATSAILATTALPLSFRGHGTFVYDAAATIKDYGSAANIAAAMKRAQMSHAWLRIHGTNPHDAATIAVTRGLISAIQAEGINIAGWGWCQGIDPAADAKMALKALADHGLSDYVADIESGHNNALWTISEIQTFCAAVRKGLKGGFALSTFALIDWHEPQLYRAAADYVDAFAPQIYWFNYPDAKMAQQFHRPNGASYPLDDPASYADLCLDDWTAMLHGKLKPLILTGQAYWGESKFSQASADAKLSAFLTNWHDHNRIAGLNWWHFGGGAGMDHAMIEAITAAKLGSKVYA
ncbi:DUF2272 domain-containing protein [Sphingomonas sp. AR_OL41]|uniref:DUF2272 domain-containing protein n=1 Tax=Sphingomonas sp. AR_OL41 TaxID=3042729 RepID=UPI00247FA2D4|nr:DUF2272 domain-containing protein [Sphingomonas sp. AR_OL41]MDH7973284.1 DUF2272 domain-containing protein [Sphingomonas sp. AR_OL41]